MIQKGPKPSRLGSRSFTLLPRVRSGDTRAKGLGQTESRAEFHFQPPQPTTGFAPRKFDAIHTEAHFHSGHLTAVEAREHRVLESLASHKLPKQRPRSSAGVDALWHQKQAVVRDEK